MMLSAIIMGIFAILGIKSLAVFGYIAIPSIVFLSLGTAARSVQTIGGWQELFNYVPLQPIDLLSGITIVIGTWILSTATCIADIMRYGKSKKDVITASTIGLLGGNTLMISCGAIAGVAMNDGDLINVLLSFGLVDYKHLYHKWCEPLFHIIEPSKFFQTKQKYYASRAHCYLCISNNDTTI